MLDTLRQPDLGGAVLFVFLSQIFFHFCLAFIIGLGTEHGAGAASMRMPICGPNGIRFVTVRAEPTSAPAGLASDTAPADTSTGDSDDGESEHCLLCVIGAGKALAVSDAENLPQGLSWRLADVLKPQAQRAVYACIPAAYSARSPPLHPSVS